MRHASVGHAEMSAISRFQVVGSSRVNFDRWLYAGTRHDPHQSDRGFEVRQLPRRLVHRQPGYQMRLRVAMPTGQLLVAGARMAMQPMACRRR